jgi:hypothetical protein
MVCPSLGIWGSTHPCGNIHNVGIIIGRKKSEKGKPEEGNLWASG